MKTRKKIITAFMWLNVGVLTVSASLCKSDIYFERAAVFVAVSAIILSIYVFGELTKEN